MTTPWFYPDIHSLALRPGIATAPVPPVVTLEARQVPLAHAHGSEDP
ncbi:hypothetical protein [Maioricimonas sp. JC845]